MNSSQQSSQKQLLRQAILIQLEAASPASLPLDTLLQGINLAGHNVSTTQLLKDLQYLEEKSLINTKPQTLSPGELRYSLSATGRDLLETQGLAWFSSLPPK